MVGAHNTGTALAESHRLIPWLATIILNQAGLMQYELLAQLLALGHLAADHRRDRTWRRARKSMRSSMTRATKWTCRYYMYRLASMPKWTGR